MATVKFSGLLDGICGTLGDTVFTTGRSGSVIRPKSNKSFPISQYLQHQMDSFPYISKYWKTLSDHNRDLWAADAKKTTFYNKFSQPYHPSSFNFFCLCNSNLVVCSDGIHDYPNEYIWPVQIPEPILFLNPDDRSKLLLDLSGFEVPAGMVVFIYLSSLLSPGRYFAEGRYAYVHFLEYNTTFPVDVTSFWLSRFDQPFDIGRIACKVKLVSTSYGSAGLLSKCNCLTEKFLS